MMTEVCATVHYIFEHDQQIHGVLCFTLHGRSALWELDRASPRFLKIKLFAE